MSYSDAEVLVGTQENLITAKYTDKMEFERSTSSIPTIAY
jgi:hypothetical protein